MDNNRKDFLIAMYNQLCSEIDRHIKVIWQIVGVLLSTFAVFALVEKDIIPLDLATAIINLVGALGLAIVIESNYWYNRNLVIIANIERQFLLESDITEIHYYFQKHRKNNAYLDMMLIQIVFIILLLTSINLYHFFSQVQPFVGLENSVFSPIKSIPYFVLLVSMVFLLRFHFKRISNYNDFKKASPGKEIGGPEIESNSDHKT